MPIDAALVAFLCNASVQIAIVGISAAIALRVARAAPARVKYRIAVSALVLCVVAPVIAASVVDHRGGTAAGVAATVDARSLAADRFVVALIYGFVVLSLWKVVAVSRGVLSAVSLRRTCIPITDGPVVASFHRYATDGRIQVCRSPRSRTPLMVGFVDPAIVVPDTVAAADRGVIDAVIAHECAHVARHDIAVAAAIELLTAPFAFHPVVAALKRAAAKYRELACDEDAIERLAITRRTYAMALLRVAECAAAPVPAGAGVVSHLEARVRELLAPPRPGRGLMTGVVASACLLASIVIAPLCAVAIDPGWRDVSGVWTLDVEHSEPRGRVPFTAARMRIETDGRRLLIAHQRTRSNGRFETFEVRGTANDAPFKVYLPGSAALQTRARWQGNRLITDAVGPGRRYREHGEAVADGNRLVITTDHSYDEARTRYQLVFRRQEGLN
jgi:beta-lactamase regulating signal transducer with metallopeptidase domain